jgi:MFS family permease
VILLRDNPAFRRFWFARVVSFTGDQLARTALLIAVFDRYGGSALGLLLLASTLPRLFGPLLGALADRFDQRRLIVLCDLAQAVLYLAIAVLVPSLPVLLVLVTVATTFATLFTPAGRSLLPGLVGMAQVPAANAQLAVGINVGVAAGPALGGLLLAGAGLTATLVVDVATFLASAVLIGGVRRVAARKSGAPEPFGTVLRAGLDVVRHTPAVRAVSIGFFVVVMFAALDNVALVPLGRVDLRASEAVVGFLGAAYGLGMVSGPLALVRSRRTVPAEMLFLVALLALGAGTIGTGVSPVVAGALTGQAVAGVGAAWHHVASDTLIQQHVPANRLGTVFGTVYVFPYAAEALAYVVGIPMLAAVGPRWVFTIAGAGVLATLAVIHRMLSNARSGNEVRTSWSPNLSNRASGG